MEASAFEAKLKAEGYPEIRTNGFDPNRVNPEHTHPFDAHAIILEGEITIGVRGGAKKYAVGEVFDIKAGTPHVEYIGPQGVRYMVGRRPK